uniref:glycosyltransferase family 2 protein n=1 Tax=uncultured Paracoccus sp. TaxID=189685 RepID=UPI00351A2397
MTLPDGQVAGYIDRYEIARDTATISGWCLFDELSIVSTERQTNVRRRLHRGDVVAALGDTRMSETSNEDGRVGFSAVVEWHEGPVTVRLNQDGATYHWPLSAPTAGQKAALAWRALLPFAVTLVRCMPLAARYIMSGRKPSLREELRAGLGLLAPRAEFHTLSRTFFAEPEPSSAARSESFTIVMPVYNAFDMLEESLSRVAANTDLPWHLVLIEDASTDPRVRPFLRDWAASQGDRVSLLENKANLGFVGSVNLGLALAAERKEHVVLLNSDAFVPSGWASRLLRPIMYDQTVASVTPMSNDASIFSVPLIAGRADIPAGAVDAIDAAALLLSSQARADAPCGVGFCMAINRRALGMVPKFDTVFGRGYGEEVDWCQRVRKFDMRNIGIGNLFVEHRGGASFGYDAKMRAMADAGRIITARYPSFDMDVQRFIREDPLFAARLCLSISLAAARQPNTPLPVYLAHSQGGGADHWLNDEIREARRWGHSCVVIRVGGVRRFAIELHSGDDLIVGEIEDIATVIDVIRSASRRHIVYSCGVGDTRPIELPRLLSDLAEGEQASLEVLFHDYLPVSPSYNLLDSAGVYRGVPDIDDPDPAHQPVLSDGRPGSLRAWREAWGDLMLRADTVRVFSNSSREIVAAAWPAMRGRITVAPHRMKHKVPVLASPPPAGGKRASLGILGSIGEVKGARFVSDLASYMNRERAMFDLVVIGEFDRSFSIPSDLQITGRYSLDDLAALARQHRVSAWLMPSIGPETFSFTVHEMLATGLPVFAFDIGAQGEAVAAAPNGRIVEQSPKAVVAAFAEISTPLRRVV